MATAVKMEYNGKLIWRNAMNFLKLETYTTGFIFAEEQIEFSSIF